MNKLRVGAVIGFELGDDYMTGLVFHVEDGVAHFVGKNMMGGVTTTWFGRLHEGKDGVVTSRGKAVEGVVVDFMKNDGYDDASQLMRNILAIAEKREKELLLESYDIHLDDQGREDELGDELFARGEMLLLREHLDKLLSKNKNFASAFEKEKKARHVCPVCGGKTSVKKVEGERELRDHYYSLLRIHAADEEKNMELTSLRQSNALMEQELDRKRKQLAALQNRNMSLLGQIRELKSRGFWDRLLNR